MASHAHQVLGSLLPFEVLADGPLAIFATALAFLLLLAMAWRVLPIGFFEDTPLGLVDREDPLTK
jgi:hypothetical protein